MKHRVACLIVLGLVLAVIEPPLSADAEETPNSLSIASIGTRIVSPSFIRSFSEAMGLEGGHGTTKILELDEILCGATVTGVLAFTDCIVAGEAFLDAWIFQGIAGQTVTIDLMSSQFDTLACLLDGVPQVKTCDDDSGEGTNSRIIFTLDSTGTWAIGVTSAGPFEVGSYTLRLQCEVCTNHPQSPSNLTATWLPNCEVLLNWQDNSDDEDEFRIKLRESGGSFLDIGAVDANSTGAIVGGFQEATSYDFRVFARVGRCDSDDSNIASVGPCQQSSCQPNGLFSVSNEGNVCAAGAYSCALPLESCFNAGLGADLAERIDASEPLNPGDLVEVDPASSGRYRKTRRAYSPWVAGVVASRPAMTLANQPPDSAGVSLDERPLLALVGRVPVQATAENGPIRPGDLLVSSSTAGAVMRCDAPQDCVGSLVGKALEELTQGNGMIEMLLLH